MSSMFNGDRWVMLDFPQLFRTQDYTARGITRHSLYHSKRYEQVLPGVRLDREAFDRCPTPTWADDYWKWDALRLRAAQLLYPGIAASHAMAARLYGWPLPSNWRTPQLHVSVRDRNSRIRITQVRLHRMTRMSTRQWCGLEVVAPEDVFIGLGGDLGQRDLVKLGDAAVGNWHGPPQIRLDELRTHVCNRPFVPQRSHLIKALDLVRLTVDSPPETNLRMWTIAVGLPEPVVHPKIYSSLLNRTVEPDLGYPDDLLALVYEGEHHLRSKQQWQSDIRRDEALRAEGWTVIHVTSKVNYQQLEAQIRHHLGLS